MIKVIFVCLISCCSWFMPLKDNLSFINQDQIQEIEKKSRDNAFFNTHYAYYSASEIGQMIPNSFGSIEDNISNFGATGNSGSYVLNNVGTYNFDSSFLSTIALYQVNTTTHNLEVYTTNQLTGVSFINYESSFHYAWEFKVSSYYHSLKIHAIKSVETFSGQTSMSWSYYFTAPTNALTETLGKMYFWFDLNSWGDYFTYPSNDTIYNTGFGNGLVEGQQIGYDKGYAEGLADSYDTGYNAGFQTGYTEGYNEGASQDATALTIMNGILEVGLLPVNVFLQMFNYEVFGINISGLISGLLTIAMTMIIIRFLFGGKENGK